MSGNATYRYDNVAILSVCGVDAPHVVTSDEFDARLAPTYRRVGLRPGLLQGLAGITERRWWPPDVTFSDAAAMAGAKALAEAGVDPAQVGLLIDTSVSRAHLEPSSAVAVHACLDLPSTCMNFDLANACLGFLNGMQLAATMIDAGQIDYALVVDGEGTRHTHEVTLDRLSRADATREDVLAQFATLTLGSGAAAMVLGRADQHPEGHRFLGGAMRRPASTTGCASATWSRCSPTPRACSTRAWPSARRCGRTPKPSSTGPTWTATSRTRSPASTPGRCAERSDIDPDRVPLTYPDPRQHGSGRGAVHPGDAGGLAADRRPGAADGHRFRAERQLRGGAVVRAADVPAPPSRRPCPGLDPKWSRLVTTEDAAGVPRTWHVLDNGAEPVHGTMLCVHGNPTWSYLWRRFLAEAPPGWRVLAVDQLGMGFSERTAEPRRLAQRVADLGAVTAALGVTGPVVTVGHDWGGPISLAWALEHRAQLRGVVLANTAVHQPADGRRAAADPAGPHSPCSGARPAPRPRSSSATAGASPGPPLPADVRDALRAPYRTAARRRAVDDFVADIPLEPRPPEPRSVRRRSPTGSPSSPTCPR